MARKKNKVKGLENLTRILETADVEGIAVILLGRDGTITIGSDGLDSVTTEELLRQSVDLISNEIGSNQTLH